MTARRRTPRVLIGVSVTAEQADALRSHGPRRDFDALATHVGGILVFQSPSSRTSGGSRIVRRLSGPHIRQAWRIARASRRGDVLFADGEHLGLPLLLFLRVLFRRPARVVMLGHLTGRWWKRLAFACLTRGRGTGTVLLHSVEQDRRLRGWLGPNWSVQTIPYQVDTTFWTPQPTTPPTIASEAPSATLPMIMAVGSEHRDYATFARAVEGLPVRVMIAAGSHWARSLAPLEQGASNVEYIDRVLNFDELREQYRSAIAVVVPLEDVPNQSGVTTILEAMSIGLPVIVTASRGQRECVTGPLVHADGTMDALGTADRGPQILGIGPASPAPATGLYVPPGDIDALRAAVVRLLEDPDLRASLGANGAETARASFTLEQFAVRVGNHLAPSVVPQPATAEVPA